MVKTFNPESAAPPAANYSQCSLASTPGEILTIAGQIGVDRGGNLATGIEAQCERALTNLLDILRANDMGPEDLMRVTVYLTSRDNLGVYREARDRILGDARPPSTLVIAGLALPEWLVEVEGQAFKARE